MFQNVEIPFVGMFVLPLAVLFDEKEKQMMDFSDAI